MSPSTLLSSSSVVFTPRVSIQMSLGELYKAGRAYSCSLIFVLLPARFANLFDFRRSTIFCSAFAMLSPYLAFMNEGLPSSFSGLVTWWCCYTSSSPPFRGLSKYAIACFQEGSSWGSRLPWYFLSCHWKNFSFLCFLFSSSSSSLVSGYCHRSVGRLSSSA